MGTLDRTLLPGAETSGPVLPVKGLGPRDEKLEMVSVLVVEPTLKAEGLSPGEPNRPQPSAALEPLLPAEKAGEDAAGAQRGDHIFEDLAAAGPAPRLVEHVRALGRVRVVAGQVGRRHHPLLGLQQGLVGRAAAVGGDPLGARRHADLVGAAVVADLGAHGVGAVAVVVTGHVGIGAGRVGRRIEPVVVVVEVRRRPGCRGTG